MLEEQRHDPDTLNTPLEDRPETPQFIRLVLLCSILRYDFTQSLNKSWIFVTSPWLRISLRAIAVPGTFLVFALYWGLVHDGGSIRVLECLTHGANFGVMLVDLVLSRQSFRLLHAVYFLSFALLYILWTVIFHVSELDRPCACSDDDDNPSQFGCQDAGVDDRADECNYVYSSLNWAGATMGKTMVLVVIIITIIIPLVVVGFHAFVLVLRAYVVPRADPECSQELQRRDSMRAFQSGGYCRALSYEMQWTHLKLKTHDWVSYFRSCHFSGLFAPK